MNTSETLTEAILKMSPFPKENLVAWFKLISSIPIVGECFTNVRCVLELNDDKMEVLYDENYDHAVIQFCVYLEPTNRGYPSPSTTVEFYFADSAEIFDLGRERIAEDLNEKVRHILGFKGTWEETVLKLVELNNIIQKHESVPPITLQKVIA